MVLPPRTGKTIIAAQVVASTGLRAVFVVPTRTLVEQTARELEMWLGCRVGTYFGERKAVENINVTTYALLHSEWRERRPWPEAIHGAELVFLDEGHHVMTPDRLAFVEHGFSTDAFRIALTATPDYDESRTLCRFFPALIHEMTLEEALALELLAPLRVWVAEVDATGSEVRLVSGEYDEQTLGRVMSGTPFLEAALAFRYARPNATRPAMVACASRQQASELVQYFEQHRPAGTPPPRLVLGETPRNVRQHVLGEFEAGRVDTLVQVGVLVEGWSSPRCKLLMDLAPSLSLVRSTQKYFRVMTRSEGEEARIYVLVPNGLPGSPVLPTELFGHWLEEYDCGSLITTGEHRGTRSGLAEAVNVAGVRVRQRIRRHARLAPPRLDPGDPEAVLHLLRSCAGFSWYRPYGFSRFCALEIRHPLFTGTGYGLLRWLGYAVTKAGYDRFLRDTRAHIAAADAAVAFELTEDANHLLAALCEPAKSESESAGFAAGWRALVGPSAARADAAQILNPEDQLLRAEEADLLAYALGLLPLRRRRITAQSFGLLHERARTMVEIAATEGMSRARASQIVRRGCSDLRWMLTGFRKPAECRRALYLDGSYGRLLAIGADKSRRYSRYSSLPELYATARPRRDRRHAGGPFQWWALPRPIDEHETDRMMRRLAKRLGLDVQVETENVSASLSDEDKAPPAGVMKFVWWTTRYYWLQPDGSEGSDVALDAEISIPGGLALWLTGRSGYFVAYSTRGVANAKVASLDAAWNSVLSHAPDKDAP